MWRVKYGELQNIDFDASDIHQYFEIFEKDIGSLKGKDRDKPHYTMSIVDILSEGESGLYCDIFYVCKQRFLIAEESSTHNITVQSVEDDCTVILWVDDSTAIKKRCLHT